MTTSRSQIYPVVTSLERQDFQTLDTYLQQDPPPHLFMFSWLENYGMTTPGRRLFQWNGVFKQELVAASLLINQRLLLLSSTDRESTRLLANHLINLDKIVDHIVGEANAVRQFWEIYSQHTKARLQRSQKFLILRPTFYASYQENLPPVRTAKVSELDAVYYASAAMHIEETLDDPLKADPTLFRKHIEYRILSENTYVWFEKGRLVFKADISAHSSCGAQISGIYVPKSMRKKGYGFRGVDALCRILFEEGFPLLTLYVNDENTAARNLYRKLGFKEHLNYHTIFVT